MRITIEKRAYDAPSRQGFYQVFAPSPYSAWSMGFTYDSSVKGDELRAYDESHGYAFACVFIINTINKDAPHISASMSPPPTRPIDEASFMGFTVSDIVEHCRDVSRTGAGLILDLLEKQYDAEIGVSWHEVENARDTLTADNELRLLLFP